MKEKNLSKLAGLAINDYNMIEEGDKIVLGVSGGIDSISLVLLMYNRLRRVPINYELKPVMIDKFNGSNEEMNVKIEKVKKYIYERTSLELDIIRLPLIKFLINDEDKPKEKNICFKCAQIRRSELIKYSIDNGYNKLAFGHHKDDIVETILMNMIFRRELAAMMPKLSILDNKLTIIRPMIYIEKYQLELYANNVNIPFIPESCPAKILKKDLRREKIRKWIEENKTQFKNFKNNIFAAARNPKCDYLLDKDFNPNSSGRFKRP